jgi:hypothetical protein
VGETLGLRFKLDATHLFDAETDLRLDAALIARGEAIVVADYRRGA